MEEKTLLKLTEFFIENPFDEFYLREIAKRLKISPFAVKKYSEFLLKQGFINDKRKANLRYFMANNDSLFYKYCKVAYNIREIESSGLIDYLKENVAGISSIVLFGSLAKGNNNKRSDIDLIVIGKKRDLDIFKFQEKLDAEINLHLFSWSQWNQNIKRNSAFYYDVISGGMALFGEMPIVK
ncbi:MAG: nucleotidyltransferase domain-containing protein [Candidatus Woesearchaeota archaeon]